jgi:CheY-like chemotaxis protein
MFLRSGADSRSRRQIRRLIEPGDFCTSAIKTTVLLAEDDELIAKLAMTHLRNLNADVQRARNGLEAQAAALAKPFDLIIMDIEMPEMDGLTAVRQLRSRGYSGQIVAATARTAPGDREECLTAGCDYYLPKPYSRDQLASFLDGLKAEPLVSNFQADAAMVELIADFVESLRRRCGRLKRLSRRRTPRASKCWPEA